MQTRRNATDQLRFARVRTLAGTLPGGPSAGSANSGGVSQFNGSTQHMGLAVRASDGAIFVADTYNHCIKIIFGSVVSIVAGCSGKEGNSDGPALDARFNAPTGLALGPDGSLFICDTNNDCVKILRDSRVTTMPSLKGIPRPMYIAVSMRSGDIFVSSNAANSKSVLMVPNSKLGLLNLVRVEPKTLVAKSRSLIQPAGLAVGPSDEIYVLDAGDGYLKTKFFMESEKFTKVCHADGARCVAVSMRENGVIYLADCTFNPTTIYRLEKDAIEQLTHDDPVGAVATNKVNPPLGLDGPISRARFSHPCGLAVGSDGDIYVADSGTCIRKINLGLVADEDDTTPQQLSGDFDFSAALATPTTDLELAVGSTILRAHRWYLEARCPQMLALDLVSTALGAEGPRRFLHFLYSNTLLWAPPPESTVEAAKTRLKDDMDLCFLLHACGFLDECSKIISFYENQSQIEFETILVIYEQCLALPFCPGAQFCVKRLRQLGPRLPRIRLTSSPLENSCELYHRILTETLAPLPTGNTAQVQRALAHLLASRQCADFEIRIGNSFTQRYHSMVLSTRWPFFAHMISADMREAHEHAMTLLEDAIEPWMLEAIITAVYAQDVVSLIKKWDIEQSLQFLIRSRMYLVDLDLQADYGASARVFHKLVAVLNSKIISSIADDNFIEIHRLATENDLTEIAVATEEKILISGELIMHDSARLADFQTLSDADRFLEKFHADMEAQEAMRAQEAKWPAEQEDDEPASATFPARQTGQPTAWVFTDLIPPDVPLPPGYKDQCLVM